MKKKNSTGEEALAGDLDFAGYHFEREYMFAAPARKWRADFFLREHALMIEVDGVLFRGKGRHQSAIGFQNDLEKMNALTAMGFRTLRFTVQQVLGKATRGKNKIPLDKAIDVVDNLILGTRVGYIDKSERGYAAKALARWPIQK